MEEFPGDQSSAADPTPETPATPLPVLPLSMPPHVELDASANERPWRSVPSTPRSAPLGAMPLSMPPFVNLEAAIPPPPPPTSGSGQGGAGWPPCLPEEAISERSRWNVRRSVAAVMAAVVIAGAAGAGIGIAVGSNSSGPASNSSNAAPSTSKLSPIISGSSAPLSPSSSEGAIAKALTPAVVDINTTIDSSSGTGQAAGSGMIVTASGEVLTNNHVVQGATSISVTISGRSAPVTATVIGVDPVHDVALLQLQGVSNLPHVVLGSSSSVKLGETVVAMGNALGLGGAPTTTAGQVTALNRSISASDQATNVAESLTGLIETDAQIQPGDSGGPLLNSAGQVIGINTAAASSDGGPSIGFAIPIDQAKAIAQKILKGEATGGIIIGLSAFLGVDVQSANTSAQSGVGGIGFGIGGIQTTPPTSGATVGQFVVSTVAGGPAASAGIVAGDTITALNGVKVTNDGATLTTALLSYKPGAQVTVTVVNQSGVSRNVSVTLGGIPK